MEQTTLHCRALQQQLLEVEDFRLLTGTKVLIGKTDWMLTLQVDAPNIVELGGAPKGTGSNLKGSKSRLVNLSEIMKISTQIS